MLCVFPPHFMELLMSASICWFIIEWNSTEIEWVWCKVRFNVARVKWMRRGGTWTSCWRNRKKSQIPFHLAPGMLVDGHRTEKRQTKNPNKKLSLRVVFPTHWPYHLQCHSHVSNYRPVLKMPQVITTNNSVDKKKAVWKWILICLVVVKLLHGSGQHGGEFSSIFCCFFVL